MPLQLRIFSQKPKDLPLSYRQNAPFVQLSQHRQSSGAETSLLMILLNLDLRQVQHRLIRPERNCNAPDAIIVDVENRVLEVPVMLIFEFELDYVR